MPTFYKFRAIKNLDSLEGDRALNDLFDCRMTYSGRKNFNDPFDSKVDLVAPAAKDILELSLDADTPPRKAENYRSWLRNGGFSDKGLADIARHIVNFNELIDTFPIYSLSKLDNNILLWAHYASCHTGFCIEYTFDEEQPAQVQYREGIDSIPLLDLLRYNCTGRDPDNELAARIRSALLVKLGCWAYEAEFRFIAVETEVKEIENYRLIRRSESHEVTAIIFGCRMLPRVKRYILQKLPFKTRFRQAIDRKDTIEIVDFDASTHLPH